MTTRHGRPGACRRRRALSAALAARHCHPPAAHDVEQGGQLHVHAVATDGLPRVRRPEARITRGHSPRPARLTPGSGAGAWFRGPSGGGGGACERGSAAVIRAGGSTRPASG
jgi:hypothetical protein